MTSCVGSLPKLEPANCWLFDTKITWFQRPVWSIQETDPGTLQLLGFWDPCFCGEGKLFYWETLVKRKPAHSQPEYVSRHLAETFWPNTSPKECSPKRRNQRELFGCYPLRVLFSCYPLLVGFEGQKEHRNPFSEVQPKNNPSHLYKSTERGQDLSGAFRAAKWILLNVGVSFLGAVLGFLFGGDGRFVSGERESAFYQGAESGKLASKGVRSGPPTSERRKRPCALNKIGARIPLDRGLCVWFPFGKPPQIRKKRPKEAAVMVQPGKTPPFQKSVPKKREW